MIDPAAPWHCERVRPLGSLHFIVPALLVACGGPALPNGDDEAGDESSDQTDSTSDDSTDTTSDDSTDTTSDDSTDDDPPECRTSADCPGSGWFCLGGVCEYEGCLDDCEVSPDECISNSDCGPGFICDLGSCEVGPQIGLALDCEPPTLQELPLPELDGVLELVFVDVDADGSEDLLALRSDGIVTLTDDDSLVTSNWPAPVVDPFANLVALSLDSLSPIDVAVFSNQGSGLAWLGQGDGAGGFDFDAEIPGFPEVSQVRAIDPELDGIDALVGVVGQDVLLFDDIANAEPGFQALPGSANEIVTGRLDPDATPDLLFGQGCEATIHPGPAFDATTALGFDPDLVTPSSCTWRVGTFGPSEQHPLALLDTPSGTVVQFWYDDPPKAIYSELPDQFHVAELIDTAELGEPFVLLANPTSIAFVSKWYQAPSACFATLPLAGIAALAVGDRDGDGVDEFATLLGDGTIRLYRMLP